MRIRFALSVPLLALLACTGAESNGSASATSSHQPPRSQHANPAPPTGREAPRAAPANWPAYHGNALRTGYARTMPAASGTPRVLRRYHLDGNVYASPIIVGGRTIVATENDTVYAIEKGRVVWRKHLGTPAPQSQLPCGNIFPLGITGTPVYHQGRVYVAPEFAGSPPRHQLYALRMSDGHIVWHRSLDRRGVDPAAMQQRGALTVAVGRVYVPFGGLAGDCGAYKGRVVGVRLSGIGRTIAYTVPTTREAGIWTTPGPVWNGSYLYVEVGNGAASFGDPYDRSDSVLALRTTLRLHQFFAPTTWRADNAADLDLGSQGPALVGKWVFADGKRGRAYVLHRDHLGGIGGAVASRDLCVSFGGTAVVGSRVFVPCTDGIRAVRIGAAGHMHLLWHASSSVWGSPVVGGGRVWSLDPDTGTLYALNPATGAVVNSVNVGPTSRFATPAIYGARIFVPTLDGLTVVATS
jgi:outer membrane protein assembly factor BamB